MHGLTCIHEPETATAALASLSGSVRFEEAANRR